MTREKGKENGGKGERSTGGKKPRKRTRGVG